MIGNQSWFKIANINNKKFGIGSSELINTQRKSKCFLLIQVRLLSVKIAKTQLGLNQTLAFFGKLDFYYHTRPVITSSKNIEPTSTIKIKV